MGWNSCVTLANHVRSEKGNVCGMIKDDRIYQVLLKYNFDLFRGDKNITEYMREHINRRQGYMECHIGHSKLDVNLRKDDFVDKQQVL